eukprot:gb/GFBE01082248.1/.p1 GENE.gb/GFBE01082248.1/~~gb/GFBE01082248.1/.p1  ORF type:complete len:270 (+),score=70.96 gb/GFBE01082248.1/:1-810(+)
MAPPCRCRSKLAACAVLVILLGLQGPCTWVQTPGRVFSIVARRASAEEEAKPKQQLWTLEVGCTDHYVWRDKDVFVGIVADAGEWTVDLDAVRAAFDEAVETGTAELFSAPLHVVKDYVKELSSYGLASRAKEAAPDAEEGGYQRRDYKELAPEIKESSEESRAIAEADASGQAMQIVVFKCDHPSMAGDKRSQMKFKAYVELAADAAQRWTPGDEALSRCYAQINGKAGKAVVLENLTPDLAKRAVDQFRASGITAEVEPMPKKTAAN